MRRALLLLLALAPAVAAAQDAPVVPKAARPTVAKLPLPASIANGAAPRSIGPQSTGQTPTGSGPALPGAPRVFAPTGPAIVSRNAPVNGVLTLFGNERCPTDPEGNEVVVCVRRDAAEQFRVPKELRELVVTPENQSWAAKAQGSLDAGVGVNGTGSCSAVGVGGASGCFAQQAHAAKRESQARKDAAQVP